MEPANLENYPPNLVAYDIASIPPPSAQEQDGSLRNDLPRLTAPSMGASISDPSEWLSDGYQPKEIDAESAGMFPAWTANNRSIPVHASQSEDERWFAFCDALGLPANLKKDKDFCFWAEHSLNICGPPHAGESWIKTELASVGLFFNFDEQIKSTLGKQNRSMDDLGLENVVTSGETLMTSFMDAKRRVNFRLEGNSLIIEERVMISAKELLLEEEPNLDCREIIKNNLQARIEVISKVDLSNLNAPLQQEVCEVRGTPKISNLLDASSQLQESRFKKGNSPQTVLQELNTPISKLYSSLHVEIFMGQVPPGITENMLPMKLLGVYYQSWNIQERLANLEKAIEALSGLDWKVIETFEDGVIKVLEPYLPISDLFIAKTSSVKPIEERLINIMRFIKLSQLKRVVFQTASRLPKKSKKTKLLVAVNDWLQQRCVKDKDKLTYLPIIYQLVDKILAMHRNPRKEKLRGLFRPSRNPASYRDYDEKQLLFSDARDKVGDGEVRMLSRRLRNIATVPCDIIDQFLTGKHEMRDAGPMRVTFAL